MDNPSDAPFPVKIPRNAPCPCGSGKKYKKCCGAPGASAADSVPGLPPGVEEFWKEPPFPFPNRFPCWRLELDAPEDPAQCEDDEFIDQTVAKVVDGFLRPYVDRHAHLTFHGKKGPFLIAILQMHVCDGEDLSSCPLVQIAEYSRMYDAFRENLGEYFANFFDSPIVCELSHDWTYGGPILTLENDGGLKETHMVAILDSP